MFLQMLFIHWKSVRFGLLPFIILAFGLPLLVVQGIGPELDDPTAFSIVTVEIMMNLQISAPLFPFLASVTGILLALSAWTWDHRGGHAYPLSLPLERWRYVLLKMGAGVVLLAIPCLAFWLGALLATSSLDIPDGLRAYPTAVAIRFFITALILYSLLFAMAAGTLRTTVWVLFAFAVVLVGGGLLSEFLGQTLIPGLDGVNVLSWLVDRLLYWPGPFEVITGNWMIIDV